MLHRTIGLAFALALSACALPSPEPREADLPVVYGHDDRLDYFDETDERWRGLVRGAIVALMPPDSIDETDPEDVRIVSGTLGDAEGLCPSERFLDDPTAAECSATLIDDDLILTAGHCAQNTRECQGYKFVFNYYFEAPGRLARITSDDVFECKKLAAWKMSSGASTIDFGIIQLDRAATPRHAPAPVRRAVVPMTGGAPVTLIGFGSGVPAKIDHGGMVIAPRASVFDYFMATVDSFGGNSGSGVFDAEGHVAGILVRGNRDYAAHGSCYVVNVLPATGDRDGTAEEITYVHQAIRGLCARGFGSQRLCAAATICGDGLCELPETAASCAADCASTCGDGRCDPGEGPTCPQDCGGASTQDGGIRDGGASVDGGARADGGTSGPTGDRYLPAVPAGYTPDAGPFVVAPPAMGCALSDGASPAPSTLLLALFALFAMGRRRPR